MSAATAAGPNMNGICRLISPMTIDLAAGAPLAAPDASSKSSVTIRIRSETVFDAPPSMLRFATNWADDVDAVGRDVARHVRVVAADVVPLRVRHGPGRPGSRKNSTISHVVRHARAVQIGDIVERHAVAEQPCHERLEEAPFQLALPYRSAQAQRGENLSAAIAGIAPRAPVELIGERIGLAHAQGQRQDDAGPDAA